jgi:predicted RNA binding protein YcfA (HicA-like mRNA interferase family)
VSTWSAAKARRVCAAPQRIGWTLKKQVGSHRKLQRNGWPNFTFCFHDGEEIGPAALARSGKRLDFVQRIFEEDIPESSSKRACEIASYFGRIWAGDEVLGFFELGCHRIVP